MIKREAHRENWLASFYARKWAGRLSVQSHVIPEQEHEKGENPGNPVIVTGLDQDFRPPRPTASRSRLSANAGILRNRADNIYAEKVRSFTRLPGVVDLQLSRLPNWRSLATALIVGLR